MLIDKKDIEILKFYLHENFVSIEKLEKDINVTERARLGSFFFKGVKKTEEDDLKEKIGLSPNKVITENLRRTSIERIEKYYIDKGYMKIISLAPEVL